MESTVRTDREKALEQARKLKAKAEHASTPPAEADTCRKMLDTLTARWGFSKSELETHTGDNDFEEMKRRTNPRPSAKPDPEPEEKPLTFEEEWELWAKEFHNMTTKRWKVNYATVTSDVLESAGLHPDDGADKIHLTTLAHRCVDIALEEFRAAKIIPEPVRLKEVAIERFLKLKEVEDLQAGKKFVGLDGRIVEPSKLTDLELAAMMYRYAQEIRADWASTLQKTEKYGKEESFRRFLAGLLVPEARGPFYDKGSKLVETYRILASEIRRRELRVKG